jgi:small subunit ribosomal protein S20
LAHHKSPKKRIRKDAQLRARNRAVKSEVRSATKKVLGASSTEEAAKTLSEAASLIDRAAKKRMIHWKTAARKKSRLAKRVRAKTG